MNLGEMYDRVEPFIKNLEFEEIESNNPEIGRRVDELHYLIKQTPVSHEIERLIGELVEICQEEFKKRNLF